MTFACSICGELSTQICARCTKDTCANHLCEKCFRCSDCCECEITLDEPVHEPAHVFRSTAAADPVADIDSSDSAGPVPEPEPPGEPEPDREPPLDPDPATP